MKYNKNPYVLYRSFLRGKVFFLCFICRESYALIKKIHSMSIIELLEVLLETKFRDNSTGKISSPSQPSYQIFERVNNPG